MSNTGTLWKYTLELSSAKVLFGMDEPLWYLQRWSNEGEYGMWWAWRLTNVQQVLGQDTYILTYETPSCIVKRTIKATDFVWCRMVCDIKRMAEMRLDGIDVEKKS